MRIAIVADWLPTFGGAEHVIAEFHRLWPDAPIYTTIARRERLGPLSGADIRVAPLLQAAARALGTHTVLLPWMPKSMECLDLRGYDVILSSSHAVAKGVVPPASAVHVCYCHTPMRYAWEMEQEYLTDFGVPRFLRRRVQRELTALRRWDLTTAKRVDVFLANSTAVQERIRRIYARQATVLPPPVDDVFFRAELSGREQRRGFLAIGRLVPYKRFDVLIQAANQLGFPLTIAGTGRDAARLRRMAGRTVRFLGFVPDAELPSLYGAHEGVLFPQIEDAGVVPLEAQACGTPVIALDRGGARDSVMDGRTGIFFREQSVDELRAALSRFHDTVFDAEAIRAHAREFSGERFRATMRGIVEHVYAKKDACAIQ